MVLRNDLIEAALQRQELLLNAAAVPVLHVHLHVILLVVLSDLQFFASGLELVKGDGSVCSVLDCKGCPIQNSDNVVGQDPLQRSVKLGIDSLYVVLI